LCKDKNIDQYVKTF